MSAPDGVLAPAVPGSSITGVLTLMDELAGLAGAGEGLFRRLEELTGLRAGELHALLAVADGADRSEAVAETTGQVDDAAAATVTSLRRRGLVTGSGNADAVTLRLTESGQVIRQQVEGIRIRLLHGVVSALGEEATGELRSTVQALGRVLSTGDAPPVDPTARTPRPLG